MNQNIDDDKPIPSWFSLGTELLENAMELGSYDEAQRLLTAPGVDPALYMLFCSMPQGNNCATNGYSEAMWSVDEIRNLMQCAFMLGIYVKKSIGDADKLW